MTTAPILISEEGIQHRLEDTLSIGRDDDNTIVLKNDRVSRHHARLSLDNDAVVLEDLKSSNGTRLNGQPITGLTSLKNDDQLGIGPFAFTLKLPLSIEVDGGATVLGEATARESLDGRVGKHDASAAQEMPLPGSWVEPENLESTQFFHSANAAKSAPVERHGDLPQLLLLDAAGSLKSVFELEPGEGVEEDVWEIGRLEACDVCLPDPTVSTRHAQLIHKAGRWRMVNLVSSNGIVVNGEKRLAVYLSDGDIVQLGSSQLAFFGDKLSAGKKAGGKKAGRKSQVKRSGSDTSAGSHNRTRWLIAGALFVLAAGTAVALLIVR